MPQQTSRRAGWVGQLEFVLGHMITRVTLSLVIILSLVPHDWMHTNDEVFLVIFVPEFIARLILAFRSERVDGRDDPTAKGWSIPRRADIFLLLVDFVALLSFLPWAERTTRWLRLFRLTRTVMLVRYWGPLATDVWTVIRRRERTRQLTLMFATVGIMAFAGTVLLNHATDAVGDDFDGDGVVGSPHDHVFWVRMYWAIRQIGDPGNMLASPHDTGTLIVSIGLTFFGLFLVSFLIGVGTDAVTEVVELGQLRSAGLKGHTVLLNLTTPTRALLDEVVGEYQKLVPTGSRLFSPRGIREFRKRAKQQREFVVVGRDADPPDFLREPEFARILYRENSDVDDEAFLTRADVPLARRVVLLADTESDAPDDETVRTLITIVERLREVIDNDERARTNLIAEIVDESNIGAAQKAIARASGRVEARIVPTERLLALFAFAVARRSRAADLFINILASSGYELYMYDYRRSETPGDMPALPHPADALESMISRGLPRTPARRVIPIGALMTDSPTEPAHVVLNPAADAGALTPNARMCGFVALAPNLQVASDFADETRAQPQAPPQAMPSGAFNLPPLRPDTPNPLRRVLVCGFRPATVNLIEAILTAEPRGEILVLVEDEDAKAAAIDAIEGHSNLVRTGLLEGLRGRFELSASDDDEFCCIPGNGSGQPVGRVVFETGDWTSSRQLMRLPRDFGTAPDMDAIILTSSQRQGSDATTATALMKLEHLQDHVAARGGRTHAQTIVAEVVNAELAHRLDRRYHAMGRDNVAVYSLHEVRAFFMFQSIVVPSFTRIFSELLSPWGQSFSRLEVSGGQGAPTFAELAAQLRTQGRVLVAVELIDPRGERQLLVGQGDPDTDRVDLAALEGIWVLQPDRAHEGTSRYPTLDQAMNAAAPQGPTAPASTAPNASTAAAPPQDSTAVAAPKPAPQPMASPMDPGSDVGAPPQYGVDAPAPPPRTETAVAPAPVGPPSQVRKPKTLTVPVPPLSPPPKSGH
ncbi:MAG: hypothetical protein AAGA54_11135 [Myxococcota bacterium]